MIRWVKTFLLKRRRERFCKLNGYNCPECIYHFHVFDGPIYRGNWCQFPKGR